MKFLFTLVVAAAVCFSATGLSAELSMQKIELYQKLVTLEIPADWHEIPADLLEYYALESAEARGGRFAELYQHGFRPGDPENDFELPQILIQVRESGRLKYGQFLHLPPIETMRRQGRETLRDRAESTLSDARVNEVYFDREDYSLHIHNTLDFKAAGKAIVHTASFLTERGLFTVHCYAHVSQNIQATPIFDRVINSVEINESIRYRPRLGDRMPPRPALFAYSIAGLLTIAIFVILIARRRHSKP